MTTPPLKPKTPPSGPTVCECGYDLTGLPVDDDAKCPECGVVVAEAIVHPSSVFSIPMLVLIALAPIAGFVSIIVWDTVSSKMSAPVIADSGLVPLFSVWLCLGSPFAIIELSRVVNRPGRWWLMAAMWIAAVFLFIIGLSILITPTLS